MVKEARRIVSYLHSNDSVDLDESTIALELHLDETFVHTALTELYREGMVTARQNEFGKVYWYAIADAVIKMGTTKTTLEKGGAMQNRIPDDNAWDALVDKKPLPVGKIVKYMVITIVLVGLVIGGVYYGNNLYENIVSGSVKNTDYKRFEKQVIVKINTLEKEIERLNARIDSINATQ